MKLNKVIDSLPEYEEEADEEDKVKDARRNSKPRSAKGKRRSSRESS